MKVIKRPEVGERVQTPYGEGKVRAILDWFEATCGLDKGKLQQLKDRVEVFLENAERNYFEYVVEDKEGELTMYDWSEYNHLFSQKTSRA